MAYSLHLLSRGKWWSCTTCVGSIVWMLQPWSNAGWVPSAILLRQITREEAFDVAHTFAVQHVSATTSTMVARLKESEDVTTREESRLQQC